MRCDVDDFKKDSSLISKKKHWLGKFCQLLIISLTPIVYYHPEKSEDKESKCVHSLRDFVLHTHTRTHHERNQTWDETIEYVFAFLSTKVTTAICEYDSRSVKTCARGLL